MLGAEPEDLIPGDFARPTSVFVYGTNRALLKWVTLALLAPYASRVWWTDFRLADERPEALDPFTLRAVPEDRIDVVHPSEMRRDDDAARRVDALTATVVRADDPPESLRRLSQFLRLPSHTQARIASTAGGGQPAILIASSAHHLVGLYPRESIAPMIHAILDAGVCLVLLWTATPPPLRTVFDVVLTVEGEPGAWKRATLRCEQGVSTGPLGPKKPIPLAELPTIARALSPVLPG
jgi:hypothetical protein